jgi:hypothetical protein
MPPDEPRHVASRLPDFLVIGAQKSGTTDLCDLLGAHPSVFISKPKELFFFCRDDVDVLPYPFFERFDEWARFDWARRRDELVEGYAAHFDGAPDGALCGEGTPFYLPSRLAAERVRETLPNVKLVAILRHPVDRAYSAYWHHVKMRRAAETFENHLRFERGGTLALGHYEAQLGMWAERFGRDRLHVVLFEEYVRDRVAVGEGVLAFLGVDRAVDRARDEASRRERPRKQNAALVPRSALLQRALNRATRLYAAHAETIEYESPAPRSLPELAVSKALRGLGRRNLESGRYPPMRASTRRKLDAYYRRRNAGLAELLGRDLAVWGW